MRIAATSRMIASDIGLDDLSLGYNAPMDSCSHILGRAVTGGGGNMPSAMALAVNRATNRLAGAGYAYDVLGNLVTMPAADGVGTVSMPYLDQGHIGTLTDAAGKYYYDADGKRRIKSKTAGGAATGKTYPQPAPRAPERARGAVTTGSVHHTACRQRPESDGILPERSPGDDARPDARCNAGPPPADSTMTHRLCHSRRDRPPRLLPAPRQGACHITRQRPPGPAALAIDHRPSGPDGCRSDRFLLQPGSIT